MPYDVILFVEHGVLKIKAVYTFFAYLLRGRLQGHNEGAQEMVK